MAACFSSGPMVLCSGNKWRRTGSPPSKQGYFMAGLGQFTHGDTEPQSPKCSFRIAQQFLLASGRVGKVSNDLEHRAR